MAHVAKRYARAPEDLAAPQRAAEWSGAVHGQVAALHQAIEAGLLADRLADPAAVNMERPVDALLRITSRTAGWLVLAACACGTVALAIG